MEFLTNFPKEEREHYEACAEMVNVNIYIEENAYNEFNILCENLNALYIKETSEEKIEAFWEADEMIRTEYRNRLKSLGWTSNDVVLKPVYLGCENIYPELKDYKK